MIYVVKKVLNERKMKHWDSTYHKHATHKKNRQKSLLNIIIQTVHYITLPCVLSIWTPFSSKMMRLLLFWTKFEASSLSLEVFNCKLSCLQDNAKTSLSRMHSAKSTDFPTALYIRNRENHQYMITQLNTLNSHL